jgi:hypothetical protein
VIQRSSTSKPEGKRPLGRPRRRWEDGIRTDLRNIGLGDVDWILLAQDRDRWRAVVSAVMNLRVLAPRSYLVQIKKQSPCTPWRRLRGEEYSSYSFTTSALYECEWSASHLAALYPPPGKGPPVPIGQKAGWAPESIWTQDRGKILYPCRGSNPDRPVVQPVARHYTAWANPGSFKALVRYWRKLGR